MIFFVVSKKKMKGGAGLAVTQACCTPSAATAKPGSPHGTCTRRLGCVVCQCKGTGGGGHSKRWKEVAGGPCGIQNCLGKTHNHQPIAPPRALLRPHGWSWCPHLESNLISRFYKLRPCGHIVSSQLLDQTRNAAARCHPVRGGGTRPPLARFNFCEGGYPLGGNRG